MSTSPVAESRRGTRLSISLPIVIHGKDARQKAFREKTHTLIVNQHGAKLLTAQQLVVGAEILVENPGLGSVAKANVVWVSPKRNADGLNEAGVQFLEAQNIWGIEFPPDDWTDQGKTPAVRAAKAAPPARPTPKKSTPAQTPSPALTSEEIATRFLQELHETTDAHARQFSERLDQIVQQIGLQWEMDLRERAGDVRKQELAAIEQQVQASTERLTALQAELEDLKARLAESRISMNAALENVPPPLTAEQIHEKIEADALPVLHQITEGEIAAARERIQAQIQADAGQALPAWKSNLQAERDALVDEARQQIRGALTSALEGLNQKRDAALEEMKRHIQEGTQENTERVVLQLKSKLDETAASHGESLIARLNETARETGERQANLLQTQLDALLVSRLHQAQQHAQSVGESLQNSVENQLRAAADKSSQELQARLQEIADKSVASSSVQVRKQVEESAHAAAEKSLQGWETRLKDMVDKTVSSSSNQMLAQVEEAARGTAERGLQVWQTQLQEIADKAAAASADQIRARVEESARAMADEALQAWQARLQEVADRAAASSADQVQGQINTALSLMGPKLQEMQDRAVNDAVEAFRGKLSQLLGLLPSGTTK
jgi:regulator of replication initiation timing